MFDAYPNFYADIAARVADLGRQPELRQLIMKHPTRASCSGRTPSRPSTAPTPGISASWRLMTSTSLTRIPTPGAALDDLRGVPARRSARRCLRR